MNFYKKNKGKIKDIPLTIKRSVYNLLKEIDFDEVDGLLKDKNSSITSREIDGLQITVSKNSIMVFIKMKYYDLDTKMLSDDKILTFKVKRTEVEDLCK
ncbi:MAG: hypothetical protein JRJ85_08100 [Deltaproteobacteria bacterium]|nr:hypothetical protein [Deltaproteobacteria bacterium]